MFFAGIDVGSRTTKAAVLDSGGRVVSSNIVETGIQGRKAAEQVFASCLEKGGIDRRDVLKVVSTGYGKKRVDSASIHMTEITCHARGAFHFFPETRTVIDIGGQDSKAILLDGSGGVLDFVMNDRCAAGTGRFLEFMAGVLDMGILRMSAVPFDSGKTQSISSLCTVFAESEVISLLSEGRPVEDIVRGLFASIAERTAALIQRIPYASPVTMTGGVAKNKGVVDALQERLKLSLNIPDEPQIVGAVGAAWIARSNAARSTGKPVKHL
ncbi:MAG: 2-hydroxyglutaryl-CoA dehydratase [Nitrospirae bacterium CG_4_9_14_3_um_filter_53_35]|nr:MAG: 2-hydroxyglutaryl-CoA dehydratase [Nitrospirae bacterium CG2_30_53_67]PIS38401.1 MAG: 2-hydroxyglutaryl-CoA dehydratase [Nitrospirae bacterium CG08_land_8_20_14_0_20_52_24]PIV85513.1 MAG: 2-hydroxyglutaryl-CoA dehydratase [Nitrospirae bacterium CG17_big_fil_post_rev_8_21_14_2_50_50_9]PIW85923.1 MAG: 2-hydroxyglutaryl-CoA dehydratase [Nitrospirae bacterium CG_4_8_14_3_um_filter_50_41]PIX84697.1 MAG: 2-hydroxyglutaryl-CoA dehydratase [Nitrospirae bacterium CG_4_10_14_3_um_filter_53_41]PJ